METPVNLHLLKSKPKIEAERLMNSLFTAAPQTAAMARILYDSFIAEGFSSDEAIKLTGAGIFR